MPQNFRNNGLFLHPAATATILLLCFIVLLPAFAKGQECRIPATPTNEEEEEYLDRLQDEASSFLLSTARWLDDFFEDDRFVAEENRSRGRLRISSAYTKNDDLELRASISWRIHLPQLDQRANLIISAADDEFSADQMPGASNPEPENDRSDLTAAVQFFVRKTEALNLSTSFGASWNYLYGGLRLRHSRNFGSWQGRFVDRLRWYTDDGWENKISYDLERRISEDWLFRTTATLSWYEEEDNLPYALLFRTYQVLGKDRAIAYEWNNYFDSEPEHDLIDVHLRCRYRQRFCRDWLVLEIAPQVTFPKEHDYQANPGLIVKLEADFGYLKDKAKFFNVFNF